MEWIRSNRKQAYCRRVAPLLGLFVTIALSVVAQEAAGQQPPDKTPDVAPTPEQLFKNCDRNADGKISLDELTAVGGLSKEAFARDFRLFDANRDGSWDQNEFLSNPWVMPLPAKRGTLADPMTKWVEKYVAALDAQLDDWHKRPTAKIAQNEFLRGLSAVTNNALNPAAFLTAASFKPDRNGDRLIDRDEARFLIESQLGLRLPSGQVLREANGFVVNYMMFRFIDKRTVDLKIDQMEFDAIAPLFAPHTPPFASGDTNKDGIITVEEWPQIQSWGRIDPVWRFRTFDANLDGKIDPEELKKHIEDWLKKLAAPTFPGFDEDKDGFLSLDEWRLTPIMNVAMQWHTPINDPNNDGQLTFGEFQFEDASFPLLRWEYFQRLDVNKDGKLDKTEFPFNTKEPDAFYWLDQDGRNWGKAFQFEGHQACGSPAISPDGRQVAFDAWPSGPDRREPGASLFLMSLDTLKPVQFGRGQMPTWSADGGRITFSGGEVQGIGIATLGKNDAGNNKVSVKSLAQGWGAQWSPDGKTIAYTSGNRIMAFDVEAETHREVMGGPGNPYQSISWNMEWSPDSRQICIRADRGNGTFDVAIVDAGGAELGFRVAHSGTAINADFAWHPKGDRVVFGMYCKERQKTQLYEFNPRNETAPTLMPGQDPERNNGDACWARDGKRLLVVSGDY